MFSRAMRLTAFGALALSLIACGPAPAATPSPSPGPTVAPTLTPEPTLPPEVEPSPIASAATAASPASSASSFAPAQRSIWNTTIGPDQMLGECAQGSVLPAYGLVQITPVDGGLEWKNQEPKPYVMARIEPNVYAFAGPTSIADGVVTMTVTFQDAKSLTMVREFTPENDAGCTHRHEYAGVFQWFR